MPMDTGSIGFHAVGDSNFNLVAPCSKDGWTGELIVDEHAGLVGIAVRVAVGLSQLELVRDGVAGGGSLLIKVGGNAVSVLPA